MLWETDAAIITQLMHARGIERGGRFRWAVYYESPELMALLDAKPEPVTWEELDA